ncbi:ABC transporter ATP-binding protein [Oleidesulfovibrio sp.]|uniref:ABC transporter ATP-binding protein n=1 Tax=Oleidesulfovibrio sp. TaxID=2909707 RepID=UPI003A871990
MDIEVRGIAKAYAGKTVLDAVSFYAKAGDIVSLVGPSGVGKTTLLRILAGLEPPDSGDILFGGKPAASCSLLCGALSGLSLRKDTPESSSHPAIMVFQDYLLFPNLTVHENVAFGLKARRMPRTDRDRRVTDMLAFFHLQDLAQRYPVQLSAGQKQRVAIARAMVVNPAVLLLDEPFANLDRNLKLETADFIRNTQKAFGITTISVTHDLEEAFAMSDRIGVMLGGRLEQYDTPAELYSAPATTQVAEFLGPVNFLPPAVCDRLALAHGGNGLRIRPEALTLTSHPQGKGIVTAISYGGHYIRYKVQVGDARLIAYALHDGLKEGDSVQIGVVRSLNLTDS